MLLDKQNIFSDAQNVIASVVSTNSIKFGKADVSYLPVIVQVVSDFVGHTNVSVDVETSETSAFTNPTVLATFGLPVAKMKEGARLPLSYLPKGNLGYMRLKYNVSGTGTSGKITAGIVAGDGVSWHEQ